ncbi:DMT family transporter [uncultured Ilyobacter sp.]|uniref:DMT family transporter n=1 Tax=uncultured Ilyobacter sp. TaxID=544433 RepID=UPI0029C99122|nr:DMT family transporter [uncultured Ilyobacter sp.]
MFFLLAFLTGGIINIQLICNSSLAKKIGLINSTFINFFVAFIFLFIYKAVKLDTSIHFDISEVPLIFFSGGLLVIIITLLANFLIPKLPLLYSTIFTFLGQIITSLILDSFYGYNFQLNKLIGISFIFTGILYIISYDYLKKRFSKDEIIG